MRAGLDLDERRDLVLRDVRDDARERVPPARVRGRRPGRSALRQDPRHFRLRNDALTARRSGRLQLARALPGAKRLDPDSQELGRLADPIAIHRWHTIQVSLVFWRVETALER